MTKKQKILLYRLAIILYSVVTNFALGGSNVAWVFVSLVVGVAMIYFAWRAFGYQMEVVDWLVFAFLLASRYEVAPFGDVFAPSEVVTAIGLLLAGAVYSDYRYKTYKEVQEQKMDHRTAQQFEEELAEIMERNQIEKAEMLKHYDQRMGPFTRRMWILICRFAVISIGIAILYIFMVNKSKDIVLWLGIAGGVIVTIYLLLFQKKPNIVDIILLVIPLRILLPVNDLGEKNYAIAIFALLAFYVFPIYDYVHPGLRE